MRQSMARCFVGGGFARIVDAADLQRAIGLRAFLLDDMRQLVTENKRRGGAPGLDPSTPILAMTV